MGDVLTERRGPVLLITLNRPHRANAIAGTVLRDLLAAFEDADADDDVRAIVTTGAGATFSVGADLDDVDSVIGGGDPVEPADLLNDGVLGGDKGTGVPSRDRRRLEHLGIGRWTLRMAAVTTPTVAALNGATGGGGLALAVLHDFRIAAAGARLTPGFLGVGVAPEMGLTYFLPRLVGWQQANRLLLRNPVLAAPDAERIGLVDEVVPDGAVLDEALRLAGELAELPSLALRSTKRLLRTAADNTLEQQLEAEYHHQLMLFGLPETRDALERLQARLRRP